MNKEQKQLIWLLGAMIKGQKISLEKDEKINWKAFLEEAQSHQVKGMIYPVVNSSDFKEVLQEELSEEWKKQTFITATHQINHIRQVTNLIEIFHEKGIEVIVLKGLVLRSYYPRPELRTMCDGDLLVKQEQLKQIEAILLDEGYRAKEVSIVHIQYVHLYHQPIEIHWTIRDERIFQNVKDEDFNWWEEAQQITIENIKVLSLGLEDLLLHLFAHMATHLSVGGFGIRQVVDVAILMKKRGHEVNWEQFCKKAKLWRLEPFVSAIFAVSQQLFETKVPEEIQILEKIDRKVVNHLIEDIMAAGVHGKKNKVHIIAHELAKDTKVGKGSRSSSVLVNFLKFLFPMPTRLTAQYGYAKKYKLLLPIAWIHHFWNGIIHQDYKTSDKVKFAFTAIAVSYRRNKLLRALNL